MERIFFIEVNGVVSEPMSFEELISKEINSDTLICEKFGEWKTAKEFPELAKFVNWQPTSPSIKVNSMETNKNSTERYLIIGLSAILLLSFFLPWIKVMISFSAKDIALGDASEFINHKSKYLLLLFPIIGVALIWLFSNTEYLKSGVTKFFTLVPISIICYIFIFTYMVMLQDQNLRSTSFIGYFEIGFWLTLLASISIPFIAGKIYKNSNQYIIFISFIVFSSLIISWLLINKLAGLLSFASNSIGVIIILIIFIAYIWTIIKLVNNIIKTKG